jgi:1-acyl-sn-glycerol-3-phosphate acyltransferase
MYSIVRAVARFWLWFFFKSVDVRRADRVPPTGPVLLCINHPNNLIDSLLVGAVLPRKVHFLATAALFRHPLVARFLLACGAIPVYRRQDDPDKMDRNVDAFAACFATLAAGGLVGIYPEGTTHAEPRVQRIRTGAARIALEFEARHRLPAGTAPLALVPVGLSFSARKSFRGRVRVAFGEPLPLAPWVASYAADPVGAVEALTAEIQLALEAQVVGIPRLDTVDLIRAVEALYRDRLVRELEEERGLPAQQVDLLRLSRSIGEAAAWFAEREPGRLEQLAAQIRDYQALLADYRVRDDTVRARLEARPLRQRVGRGGLASLGLPVFLYAAAVNGLPYLLPRWLARRTARKETDYATTRLLASVVAFPLFWGLETWLVLLAAGPLWAAAFLVSLPVSGLVGHRYLAGAGRLGGQIRLGLLALTRRQAAGRLLAARRALLAELDRAKTDYLAATKGSSF